MLCGWRHCNLSEWGLWALKLHHLLPAASWYVSLFDPTCAPISTSLTSSGGTGVEPDGVGVGKLTFLLHSIKLFTPIWQSFPNPLHFFCVSRSILYLHFEAAAAADKPVLTSEARICCSALCPLRPAARRNRSWPWRRTWSCRWSSMKNLFGVAVLNLVEKD